MEVINTTGRRKTAVARVYVQSGNGTITINDRDYKEYFPSGTLQYIINQPMETAKVAGQYDITVNVDGGGVSGQAEAVRLGISRALCEIDPAHRTALKPLGLLTRDPRMVERKKPGQKKARKRFQFSKR
jgi:small subunit ribosomal protein S9